MAQEKQLSGSTEKHDKVVRVRSIREGWRGDGVGVGVVFLDCLTLWLLKNCTILPFVLTSYTNSFWILRFRDTRIFKAVFTKD
jgi:hypothetical protein